MLQPDPTLAYTQAHTPATFDGATAMFDGPARDALRLAAATLDIAEQRGRPLEMSSAHALLARCYRLLDAPAAAEDSLRHALRWARGSGSVDLQVDVLCDLADAACAVAVQLGDDDLAARHSARERARDVAFEVSTLARSVADTHWEAKALLRASDVLNRCGDHDDAAWLQGRALVLMAGMGVADGSA